jgi:hypothetical protein
MDNLFKIYDLIKSVDVTPTTIIFVSFIIIGTVVAKLYIGPPK